MFYPDPWKSIGFSRGKSVTATQDYQFFSDLIRFDDHPLRESWYSWAEIQVI